MKLRSGKIISSSVDVLNSAPSASSASENVSIPFVGPIPSRLVSQYDNSIEKNICKCGKICDLTINECCRCIDKRINVDFKEWRGHGIVYSNSTFGYCPKCRNTTTEIYQDLVNFGFFQ